jgi:ribosomal protein S11
MEALSELAVAAVKGIGTLKGGSLPTLNIKEKMKALSQKAREAAAKLAAASKKIVAKSKKTPAPHDTAVQGLASR